MAVSKYGMISRLVWDGGDEVRIPEELGKAAPNQMIGTAAERVSELGGRACYDSLGRGRSSEDYHKHILDVGHGSVYEHFAMTVQLGNCSATALWPLINRPGIWVEADYGKIRVTFNPRAILDWNLWTKQLTYLADSPDLVGKTGSIGDRLSVFAERSFPQIVPPRDRALWAISNYKDDLIVEPCTEQEKWISMFLCGSRGFSHEQVRHKFRTAVSQRCLAGDTAVTFVHGGGHAHGGPRGPKGRTIQWLHERMQQPRLRPLMTKLRPRVLDEHTGLFTFGRLLDVIRSGRKPCFEMELEDGKTIKCTEDHRIWTQKGWKTLFEIAAPSVTDGGVVTWNRETSFRVGVNGLKGVGNCLYRDARWMRERVDEKLSDEGIAGLCGATPGTVKAYRIRHGLKKRTLRDFSGSQVRDKDWLWHHYRVLDLSHAEIARLANCPKSVVHNWCRKHGIQKARREINLGRSPWNKGKSYSQAKPYSAESIARYRESKTGPKNPRWKGGVSASVHRRAFQAWKRHHRREVFERDGWCCRLCGRHSSKVPVNGKHLRKRTIEIHHILPLWNRPDLACEKGNMATVCWECQAKKLNGHELDYAERLLKAIASPIPYSPSEKIKPHGKRVVRVHFKKIASLRYVGIVDTYDLVLEGPNHGFVGNGVVVHNSTRFVNEAESPWVDHPLVQEYMWDKTQPVSDTGEMERVVEAIKKHSKETYVFVVDRLEPWLAKRGVDKLTARKQARGAARGYLGNALWTEMIFSASVAEWKWMMQLRCSSHADAEIRGIFCEALPELRSSRYGDDFKSLELVPAPDGLGQMAVEVSGVQG